MITAANAKIVSDAVNNGDPIDPNLIYEANGTGNLIIDELNHAVVWAAKEGKYATYLAVSKFSDAAVQNAVTTSESLGYTVDSTRLKYYKEIVLSWD